jgi:hypothetical protein
MQPKHTGYEQWKTHKFNQNTAAKYNYYHGYVKFFQKDMMIVPDMVVGVNIKDQPPKLSPQAMKNMALKSKLKSLEIK